MKETIPDKIEAIKKTQPWEFWKWKIWVNKQQLQMQDNQQNARDGRENLKC